MSVQEPVVSRTSKKQENSMKPVKNLVFIILTSLPLIAQFSPDKINIHGFVNQGYVYSGDNNYLNMNTVKGSFEFNEVAINFSTGLTDRLHAGIQLLSRDLGKVGNNMVMLDWAYADYRWRDYLGIRIGKIKTPLALYNEIRDVDALRTFILLPQSVYDENVRDFSFAFQGAALYGNIGLGKLGELEYNLYSGTFNIPDPKTGFWYNSFMSLRALIEPFLTNETAVITHVGISDPAVTADYIWGGSGYWNTPVPDLKLGGCYLYGSLTMSTDIPVYRRLTLSPSQYVINEVIIPHLDADIIIKDYYTLSGEYTLNNLSLTGEFHRRIYKVHIRKNPILGFAMNQDYRLEGYYGQITYRLLERLELGAYYSSYTDKDSQLPGEPKWYYTQADICGAIRFDITPSWLVKLEGHQIDGVGLVIAVDNPAGIQKEWRLIAVKSSISF
jgi:hypothetical protein